MTGTIINNAVKTYMPFNPTSAVTKIIIAPDNNCPIASNCPKDERTVALIFEGVFFTKMISNSGYVPSLEKLKMRYPNKAKYI